MMWLVWWWSLMLYVCRTYVRFMHRMQVIYEDTYIKYSKQSTPYNI